MNRHTRPKVKSLNQRLEGHIMERNPWSKTPDIWPTHWPEERLGIILWMTEAMIRSGDHCPHRLKFGVQLMKADSSIFLLKVQWGLHNKEELSHSIAWPSFWVCLKVAEFSWLYQTADLCSVILMLRLQQVWPIYSPFYSLQGILCILQTPGLWSKDNLW